MRPFVTYQSGSGSSGRRLWDRRPLVLAVDAACSSGPALLSVAPANVTSVGKTLTCTATTAINTSSAVAFTGNSDIRFTAPLINIENGFRVDSSSRFTAGD